LTEIKIIEAALFSAGTPLSIEEIKESTDIAEKKIKEIITDLIEEYKTRDSALEIAKVGDKYAMQLRPEYATHVTKFAEMEIPVKVLKTAALIAYHQPILQRDLFDMVGYRLYEHVKILNELGLIRRRDSGRSKLVTTTERFSEYFGIDTTDREEIKKWLINKLNVKLPDNIEKKEEEGKEPDIEKESESDSSASNNAEVDETNTNADVNDLVA
jgi:segregation and condensation protein B